MYVTITAAMPLQTNTPVNHSPHNNNSNDGTQDRISAEAQDSG